ncbi:unnamed protein product [Trichogramma brassicae]|uniref:Uncharacterized protein n=1 Tax=Trichogramma brassicae TaxID=86971 RepID=A0A6H5INQ4_9HYME|nr:unnamed protein product [Trichogramma brassicae]
MRLRCVNVIKSRRAKKCDERPESGGAAKRRNSYNRTAVDAESGSAFDNRSTLSRVSESTLMLQARPPRGSRQYIYRTDDICTTDAHGCARAIELENLLFRGEVYATNSKRGPPPKEAVQLKKRGIPLRFRRARPRAPRRRVGKRRASSAASSPPARTLVIVLRTTLGSALWAAPGERSGDPEKERARE